MQSESFGLMSLTVKGFEVTMIHKDSQVCDEITDKQLYFTLITKLLIPVCHQLHFSLISSPFESRHEVVLQLFFRYRARECAAHIRWSLSYPPHSARLRYQEGEKSLIYGGFDKKKSFVSDSTHLALGTTFFDMTLHSRSAATAALLTTI